MTIGRVDVDERPRLAERSVVADVRRLDRARRAYRPGRGRRPSGETAGPLVMAIPSMPVRVSLPSCEAVEGAGLRFLAIVHRPEPEPAGGIDDAVVEPVVGRSGSTSTMRSKSPFAIVEVIKSGLQPGDEAAALGRAG